MDSLGMELSWWSARPPHPTPQDSGPRKPGAQWHSPTISALTQKVDPKLKVILG